MRPALLDPAKGRLDPCQGAQTGALRFAYRVQGFPLAADGRFAPRQWGLKEDRQTSPSALRCPDWRQYRNDRADLRGVVCVYINPDDTAVAESESNAVGDAGLSELCHKGTRHLLRAKSLPAMQCGPLRTGLDRKGIEPLRVKLLRQNAIWRYHRSALNFGGRRTFRHRKLELKFEGLTGHARNLQR